MPIAQTLRSSVVVITGASSGIGRATALLFASQGAAVVLAARRENALLDVAAECASLGVRALAIPTDVTDEAAVQELARRALEQFGHIDVWVNNAGVALFAPFDDAPSKLYSRVMETNLGGTIHGARAALECFFAQGSGVLINISSTVAVTGLTYGSAYAVSKAAVRSLGQCLRQELALTGAKDIHVCTVLPSVTDTPIWQHSANYTGRAVQPVPPILDVDEVARAIVDLALHPRREVIIGRVGRFTVFQSLLTPGLAERVAAHIVKRVMFLDTPAPISAGNVMNPLPSGLTSASGGWKHSILSRLGTLLQVVPAVLEAVIESVSHRPPAQSLGAPLIRAAQARSPGRATG